MTDKEFTDLFEKWSDDMHGRLSSRLSESGDIVGMDELSDSGYWKTMCVAAWADKQFPEQAVGIALTERLACLWRETEAADTEEDGTPVVPQSDELRSKIRELWNTESPL